MDKLKTEDQVERLFLHGIIDNPTKEKYFLLVREGGIILEISEPDRVVVKYGDHVSFLGVPEKNILEFLDQLNDKGMFIMYIPVSATQLADWKKQILTLSGVPATATPASRERTQGVGDVWWLTGSSSCDTHGNYRGGGGGGYGGGIH